MSLRRPKSPLACRTKSIEEDDMEGHMAILFQRGFLPRPDPGSLPQRDFYSSAQYKDFEDLQKKILEWVENGQQEGVFIKDFPGITYFHMIIGTLDQFLVEQFLETAHPWALWN